MPIDPARYKSPLLADLTQELLNATAAKRAGYLRNAEALHDVLGEEEAYPLDFVVFRVLDRRRQLVEPVVLVGGAAAADLRELIGDVSESLDLPAIGPDADEPAETTPQLAHRLRVSTRTIARWRKRGLRWRWVVPPPDQGQKQIGFTASAIRNFHHADPSRIARATGFTQIPDAQRRALIRRAARIAGRCPHLSLNRVAAHLARKAGRAHETLRLILEAHDRDSPPHRVIFRDRTAPLTGRQRRVIARARRMGVKPHKIARHFGRSVATVRRVVLERRAREALRLDLSRVESPMFDREDAEAVLLQPPPGPSEAGGSTSAAQRSRFVYYNFLKHRAAAVRERFRHPPILAGDLDAFDRLAKTIQRARRVLLDEHHETVLSVARRHLAGHGEGSEARMQPLVEAGDAELREAVEAYDATRASSFTGQLTNRLLRRFATAGQDA